MVSKLKKKKIAVVETRSIIYMCNVCRLCTVLLYIYRPICVCVHTCISQYIFVSILDSFMGLYDEYNNIICTYTQYTKVCYRAQPLWISLKLNEAQSASMKLIRYYTTHKGNFADVLDHVVTPYFVSQ